jgi:glucose-1-phosphate cytidylyltransferase
MTKMKVIILCGGRGIRLAPETGTKPKPMVEIGGKPILWHIMNIYAAFGYEEFILALGYLGEEIKKYFVNLYLLSNDLTVDLNSGSIDSHGKKRPRWRVHLVDTGRETETGGRIKRLQPWIGNERFMVTYGDGVANININRLIDFHRSHGKLATITVVRPPARFGKVTLKGDQVTMFAEKGFVSESTLTEGWINGGFFVLEPEVFDYIKGDDTHWEWEPLRKLAADGQLMAYKHDGFWQPMDTLRDKLYLDKLWNSGKAPWKIWE